ncbi:MULTISPECIES: hypothetical protein [unclassified Streptomyces]|uniref:Uncharacterized protein n=1 Tax=Streptomyces sp. F12 TaxID=1436084 RepID=V9ZAJ7_9ACTN|nr:hypothetical protein [Streptomyces sp. F12]AHE40456.1 Hypothetical protein pFRL6_369c [Streptomyces sp. F12]
MTDSPSTGPDAEFTDYGAAGRAAMQEADPGAAQLFCRLCGSAPAELVTFRGHVAFLVLMRFTSASGPFCRRCGTAVFREFTARALWQGWWSPLSLVLFTPTILVVNRLALRRINRLPSPGPAAGAGLTPGRRVMRRKSSLVALIPLLWGLWVLSHIVKAVAT